MDNVIDDNCHDHGAQHSDSVRLPWISSTQVTVPSSSPPPVSKRAVSGGLFSRFSFLRPTETSNNDWLQQGIAPRSKTSIDDEDGGELRTSMTSSMKQDHEIERQLTIKQRKRKGSLRKSALLGVRRLGSDGRERRNSLLQRASTQEALADVHGAAAAHNRRSGAQAGESGIYGTSTESTSSVPDSTETHTTGSALATQEVSVAGEVTPVAFESSSDTLSSRSDVKNPLGDTSTTEDDDDILPFKRPAQPVVSGSAVLSPTEAMTTSYFAPQAPRSRTRSARRLHSSPLQHAQTPAPEPYSYTETEYWGWVILFVTWLLFTVGMGSCLDIWSWAWDVGETPYAPPELEDDPTLPIVGYYPALIVLTGVVAWVWITVAWVGMKYFRHAKIEDIR